MWGGSHKQEISSQTGEKLTKAISFGILSFATPESRRHFVGLITNNQVPFSIRGFKFFLDSFVSGEFIKSGNYQVRFKESVLGARGLKFVIRQDIKMEMEPLR